MAKKRRQSSTTSAWSDLPESLLYTILTLLPSIRDLVSFSSVCRSWRRSSVSASSSLLPPFLLYPLSSLTRSSTRPRVSGLRLHDPAGPSVWYPLSCASGKSLSSHFLAYSHGHLLFLSSNHILIINPLTDYQLLSPVITPKFNFAALSGLLTAPPSSSDSSLLLFSSGSFFQWRIGSSDWCSFGSSQKLSNIRLITVNRQIYAIDSYWRLYVSDFGPELSLRDLEVDGLCESISFSLIDWFVDCGGELLFLQFEPAEEMMNARSNAFRLENSSWVKLESLGEWAVFVGPNASVPGLACKNPERWGGRRNCIYFARNNGDGNAAWAEMELGEEIDISEPESPLSRRNSGRWPAPLWLYPSIRTV